MLLSFPTAGPVLSKRQRQRLRQRQGSGTTKSAGSAPAPAAKPKVEEKVEDGKRNDSKEAGGVVRLCWSMFAFSLASWSSS